ncbi:RNA-guided pseudouridylation complex pseudouridine synthase subunit Cbf5 [Candidatus Micrarchaeota archaeon]|nr:RNA-guided pseudouridylation complex pseudouridine synthase subunit Cbf5 [Candidatus Micrarchaeota archaeon]
MGLITLLEEESSWGTNPSKRSVEQLLSNSLVLIDKPCGPTSHEVSSIVKKLLHAKKAGHTGTLDPDVSGVLPVLINEATKIASGFLESEKQYACVMSLSEKIPEKKLLETLDYFTGKIYQTPPEASAVKKELRVREVYELKLLEFTGRQALFLARVEGGTYIRTLCEDIGLVLGFDCEMAELRRTCAAGFSESQCVTLQDLSDAFWLYKERNDETQLKKMLLPIEQALKLKKVIVSDGAVKPISTGADLAIPGINQLDEEIKVNELVLVESGNGQAVCIAKALMGAKEIASQKKGIAFDVQRVFLN